MNIIFLLYLLQHVSADLYGHNQVKVKGLDRSLVLQQFEVPTISIQSAHEGGKVVSTTNRSPLSSRRYSWYSFLLEAESTIVRKD